MTRGAQTKDEAEPDFEATISELEKVVQELEGDVKLEHALSLFDRGMKLSARCKTFLDSAEQKVELLRRDAAGTLSLVDYAGPEGGE